MQRLPDARCRGRALAGLSGEWRASGIAEAECSSVDADALPAGLAR